MATLFASTCGAVGLSQDGRGQVLIYPYYTVNGGFNTLLSVFNTRNVPKAVKVTFYEGKRGVAVLRFNLYLAANDGWTLALSPSGSSTGLRVHTTDRSCTVPGFGVLPFDFDGPLSGPGYEYDGEDTSPARTREGHIEVVEMGEVGGTPIQRAESGSAPIPFNEAVSLINGSPVSCDSVASAMAVGGELLALPDGGLTAPTGGLMGSASVINVGEGTDYGYDPVALSAFRDRPWHTDYAVAEPSLGDASPRESVMLDDKRGLVRSTWNALPHGAADPVSAVLMSAVVINEFVLDVAIQASTSFVVTFPTKRFYVKPGQFKRPFTVPFRSGGGCEAFAVQRGDREGQVSTYPGFFGGVPPPPPTLCFGVNVVNFNDSGVFDSPMYTSSPRGLGYNLPTWFVVEAGFASLLLDVDYLPRHSMVDDAGLTYRGLPTIGFSAQRYVNGNVASVLSNYGGSFVHKYERAID